MASEQRRRTAKVNVGEEKNYQLWKKVFLQMAICFVIYFIFYLIQNSNYLFSEQVMQTTKQILSYDINVPQLYEQVVEWFRPVPGEVKAGDTNTVTNEQMQNTITQEEKGKTAEVSNAIGGAEVNSMALENTITQETMEKQASLPSDEEYINTNFSFITPVKGAVSSEFGQRDVENPLVSKNHVGIDIAANTGTAIQASMEGRVEIASTQGDYGYHIKIKNNDVSTLYAHCSKLYVEEGQYVTQGQIIAEVGSTGKSTGPHLHFEIMRNQTYINPRNIVKFE